jgi:hypothetical protein
MTDPLTWVTILNAGISGCAGLVGVGIGLGIFRTNIKRNSDEIVVLKGRQARLRGEGNGNPSVFMPRGHCVDIREHCAKLRITRDRATDEDLAAHSKTIKALENFARWWMQKEGLHIEDINRILDGS